MSAQPKAPGGMDEVLFIRCDAALKAAIAREGKRRAVKGARYSQSDMARVLLWEALRAKPEVTT